MKTYDYVHVDAFAEDHLQGNGVAVVFCDRLPDSGQMLEITREFKQFETIFLSGYTGGTVNARIFTMEGELPFAGHPIIGATAALHDRFQSEKDTMELRFMLAEKQVPVSSARTEKGFSVRMQQGKPAFLGEIPDEDVAWILAAHNLSMRDWDVSLPIEVVSTGLPYVLIPVTGGLDRARITVRNLGERIAAYGASYTYLFDTRTLEARTWDNLGLVEDSATGSAAGPVCAYLVKHNRLVQNEPVEIHQGRYANRPGLLHASMVDGEVYVSGQAIFFARGSFTLA